MLLSQNGRFYSDQQKQRSMPESSSKNDRQIQNCGKYHLSLHEIGLTAI